MPDYDKDTNFYQDWSVVETPYTVLEWYVLLETIGPVTGLEVLDLACGEGRLARVLMARGAASVLGVDISQEMIARARAKNRPGGRDRHFERLRFEVGNAGDARFSLDKPVDCVTALYLFHYAESEQTLQDMCRLVSRNLKPGGHFVHYGINPSYDFELQHPNMGEIFGFHYKTVEPPHHLLVIGDFEASFWQWSKTAHEEALLAAGLTNLRWHPLKLPDERSDLTESVQWYLDNPSCVVLSAEKPAQP